MKFTWNPEKAMLNLQDHRVSFAEALTVFGDPLARIHDDPGHSEGELREMIVGHSSAGRLLLVCFTEGTDSIRLFSAREVTSHERRKYEER